MKYKRFAKFLGVLTVIGVLMSVALTFAQPFESAMKEDINMENHEEYEENMDQMHEECADMMDEMHQTNRTRMHNEDEESHESHGRHGCHQNDRINKQEATRLTATSALIFLSNVKHIYLTPTMFLALLAVELIPGKMLAPLLLSPSTRCLW